jgi:hypothetical protein
VGQRKTVLVIPASANFIVTASGNTANAQLMATALGTNTSPDGLPWSQGLATDAQDSLLILVNVAAISGTTPAIVFGVDTLGDDGVWYRLASSTSITAINGQWIFTLAGQNSQSQEFGAKCRLAWTVAGTSPSVTFSATIFGK